jgi:hypothetical protein
MENQQEQKVEKVNVALQSIAGHFVEKHNKVVCLDGTTESFFVEGEADLTTENHETLKLQKDVLVVPQKVYDPYSESLKRSMD